MTDELELIKDEAEEKMEKAIKHLEYELSHLRAGRANPLLLDGITVDYYGTMTQLAQVSTLTPRTLRAFSYNPGRRICLVLSKKQYWLPI